MVVVNSAGINADYVRHVLSIRLNDVLTLSSIILIIMEPCRRVLFVLFVFVVIFKVRLRGFIIPERRQISGFVVRRSVSRVIAHERIDARFLFFPSKSAAIHFHEALLFPPFQQTSFPLEIRGMCLLLKFYGFFE